MVTDPITGLDTSIVDPYLYQIPLTTNPIQAPEWGFQGHYDQILHPDNIPAVFATAQGYDESNPGAAQALHMDGQGNLYVKERGGGTVSVTHSFADTAEPAEATLYTFSLGIIPQTLLSFTGSMQTINYNGPDHPQHVAFWLQGTTTGKVLNLVRFAIAYDGSPISGQPWTESPNWGSGLNISGYFSGDTDVELQAITNTVFGTISWTLNLAVA